MTLNQMIQLINLFNDFGHLEYMYSVLQYLLLLMTCELSFSREATSLPVSTHVTKLSTFVSADSHTIPYRKNTPLITFHFKNDCNSVTSVDRLELLIGPGFSPIDANSCLS